MIQSAQKESSLFPLTENAVCAGFGRAVARKQRSKKFSVVYDWNSDSSLNQDYLDSAGLSLKGRDCMSVRCGPVAVPVCACERERKLPVCRGKV